jgi:hypothetical protein
MLRTICIYHSYAESPINRETPGAKSSGSFCFYREAGREKIISHPVHVVLKNSGRQK